VRQFKRLPPKLLAEKVETLEQFEQCRDLGFDFFQGYFFAMPVVLNKKRIDIAGSSLVRLQQLLLKDAEITVIEDTFKGSPNLVFNLLRLVNSVGMGLLAKVRTVRHAIAILGRRQLLRWTYLAMFAAVDNRPGSSTLLELAALRGRLMELLVQRHMPRSGGNDLHECAFITGILSLVDQLYETPMEQVVSHFNLDEEVRRALLFQEGELGTLLRLVGFLERTDVVAALPLLDELQIGQEQLLVAQLDAISWTRSLTEAD
jgi:c-di-GMP-related signal transduction protein